MLPGRAGGVGGNGDQAIADICGDAVVRHSAIGQPTARGVTGQWRRHRCQHVHLKLLGQNGCCSFDPTAEPAAGGGQIQKGLTQTCIGGEDRPKAISQVFRRCVADILPPRLALFLEKPAQVGRRNLQQWTANAQTADHRSARHSGQGRRTGTAQQTLQNGLGLVVGVMSENDASELIGIDDSFEKSESGGAKAGGQIGNRRQSDLAANSDRAGKRQPIGQLSNKFGVICTLAIARLMVEMDDVQREIGPALQE